MPHRIYFDNASTTKVYPEVLDTYKDLLTKYYVNSESLYDEGSEVHRMMEKARGAIAGLLEVNPDEIIFTSGASESNSLAIKGAAFSNKDKKHIVTSSIEHSSVLNACKQLEEVFGYEVTYLPVDASGKVSLEDLKKAIREDTVLVSLMYVNNEVGSIFDIDEIKEYVKKKSHAIFHVDLTQAVGKIPFSLKDIDLASMSAHKIHGLKGSGILVKKKHIALSPIISGGEQEYGLRGGTSNACVNMVFAKTLRLALENMDTTYVKSLKEYCLEKLGEIQGIHINQPKDAIDHIINFSYEKIPSEVMQNALNRKGFMVSARSTCESKELNTSYVLKAMGLSDAIASSCIRLSFSNENTKEEIDLFIQSLKEIIQQYG